METLIDAAFINQIELKWPDIHFTRVDSDITENLVDKQTESQTVLVKEEEDKLRDLFSIELSDLHISVDVKGLSPESPPVIATRPEFMRRMKDMASISGSMGNFYANMPDEVTLTINGNHPIYQNILTEEDKEKQSKVVRNLADLALLSQGLLKGNNLTSFIERSVDLMQDEKKSRIILT
jgi:molecular chaperone HtpG